MVGGRRGYPLQQAAGEVICGKRRRRRVQRPRGGAVAKWRAVASARPFRRCGCGAAAAGPAREPKQRRRRRSVFFTRFARCRGSGLQWTGHLKALPLLSLFFGSVFGSNFLVICRKLWISNWLKVLSAVRSHGRVSIFLGESKPHRRIKGVMILPRYFRYLASVTPDNVPLKTYCHGMRVVDWFTPAGSLPLPGPPLQWPLHGILSDSAKAISRRTLGIFDALFRECRCLRKVDHNTIVVDRWTGLPRISKEAEQDIVWVTCPQDIDRNTKELADVLEECLFTQNNQVVETVVEVAYGLFPMMRESGNTMWYAIYHNSALVPLRNLLDFYLRMHRFLVEVLAVHRPEQYRFVLRNLLFPHDWHTRVHANSWMYTMYCGSVYNSINKTHDIQAEEISRFLRNSGVHCLQFAVQQPAKGAEISPSDVARMHHALAPMINLSMQWSLQLLGWLTCTEIDTLFNCS